MFVCHQRKDVDLRCCLFWQHVACLQVMAALLWQHLADLHGGVGGQGWGWCIKMQAHVTQDLIVSMNLER